MRDTWLAAQVMTGRRHFPIGPANVLAFTDPLEDVEMLQHITVVPLELRPASRIVCVVDVLLFEEGTSPW